MTYTKTVVFVEAPLFSRMVYVCGSAMGFDLATPEIQGKQSLAVAACARCDGAAMAGASVEVAGSSIIGRRSMVKSGC